MAAVEQTFWKPATDGQCVWTRIAARWIVLPLLLASVVASTLSVRAQTRPQNAKPYATLDRDTVAYRGPGRESERGLPEGVAIIGLMLPLRGRQEAEGKALAAAAELALEEEAATRFPDGRRLVLGTGDETGPWGQASSEILKLIEEDHALALITSANGSIAHQAEQISNKLGVPILTLASDATTTEINMPWLFRLGASDADQARAFAQRIYQELDLKRVLLVSQGDHDGRTGAKEFMRARERLRVPQPDRLELSSVSPELDGVEDQIRAANPQAVVLWTDSKAGSMAVTLVREAAPGVPIFVCSRAAQLRFESGDEARGNAPTNEVRATNGVWVVGSNPSLQNESRVFIERYVARTGRAPSFAAFQVHDAVRMIAAALQAAGANRVRLRDALASGATFQGLAGTYSFDPAGNLRQAFTLVRLPADAPTETGAENAQSGLR